MQEFATEVLWALSGRRWGVCLETVRPCLRTCLSDLPTGLGAAVPFVPYLSGGVWRNALPCGCGTSCGCGTLCEVRLPGPVAYVETVMIDGEELPVDAYRVDTPNLLVRTDGECWPTCQDLAAPDDGEGAFTVVYGRGLEPSPGAIHAVSELTHELVRACLPDCDCSLPKNITSRVVPGVTTEFIPPQEFLTDGKTGLYDVDLWLNAVNPRGLPHASRVLSPDHQGPRRRQL